LGCPFKLAKKFLPRLLCGYSIYLYDKFIKSPKTLYKIPIRKIRTEILRTVPFKYSFQIFLSNLPFKSSFQIFLSNLPFRQYIKTHYRREGVVGGTVGSPTLYPLLYMTNADPSLANSCSYSPKLVFPDVLPNPDTINRDSHIHTGLAFILYPLYLFT